jgi:hypothetical protein
MLRRDFRAEGRNLDRLGMAGPSVNGIRATVLGPVSIGDYAKVGANAFVINHDVPADCTVVGTPARIAKLHGERVDGPLPRTKPPTGAVPVELEI